jgi:hypothetical protein
MTYRTRIALPFLALLFFYPAVFPAAAQAQVYTSQLGFVGGTYNPATGCVEFKKYTSSVTVVAMLMKGRAPVSNALVTSTWKFPTVPPRPVGGSLSGVGTYKITHGPIGGSGKDPQAILVTVKFFVGGVLVNSKQITFTRVP